MIRIASSALDVGRDKLFSNKLFARYWSEHKGSCTSSLLRLHIANLVYVLMMMGGVFFMSDAVEGSALLSNVVVWCICSIACGLHIAAFVVLPPSVISELGLNNHGLWRGIGLFIIVLRIYHLTALIMQNLGIDRNPFELCNATLTNNSLPFVFLIIDVSICLAAKLLLTNSIFFR